ncbi:hypothetical protein BH10BAC4_BH10BAC4_14280 [soil metagenome]
MNSSFQKLFATIELQRQKTLDSVRHLSEEHLNKPPGPDKWSAAQILSHLIAGERMSFLYIKKKIQGVAQATDTGIWEEVKINLLKLSQRLPGLKFKAPRIIIEHTPLYKDLPTIIKEWDQVRDDLKQLLETIPDQYINRRVYKHPRAGYLNVRHALLFFREHVIHHTPQIKRLLDQN